MPFNNSSATTSGSSGGGSTPTQVFKYDSVPPTLVDGALAYAETDVNGRQLTNPGIYNTPFAPSALNVTTTSQTLLPANPARTGLFFQNPTAINVWAVPIAAGTTSAATAPPSFRIAASGGYLSIENSVVASNAFAFIAESGTPVIGMWQAS